jgi:hypothetical protein
MKPVILTCFMTILFLTTTSASDIDLVPSKRFQSVQMIPQLEAALRNNDEGKMLAVAKRLAHVLIDTKWQLYESMMHRVGKTMPLKEGIEYRLCFFKYEFEKRTRNIKKTTTFETKVRYEDIEPGIEDLLRNRNCNDLRSFLASLYRKALNIEICGLAFHEAPDSIWKGAEYSQVLTLDELDDAWARFRGCYFGACDHLVPETMEFYINQKLSASHQIDFMGYDTGTVEDPKGWISWIRNAFRSCGKRIHRKKEDQAHLYLAQMSIRVLQYAASPEFQAVVNPNVERRIYYTPWKTTLFELFCLSCLKWRGYRRGKPYEMYQWRQIPATKRTKLLEVEKQLEGKVARNVGQTVKRGLGLQSLAEKKDELFNTLAVEKERLQKEVAEASHQLELIRTELRAAKAEKAKVNDELLRARQDNLSLKAQLVELKKKHEEGEEGANEQQIQLLSAEVNALKEAMRQQKSEIQRLEGVMDGKEILLKAHHGSYARLQQEVQEKDALIRELKSTCSALPDEATVNKMSVLIQRLRDKITTLEPLVITRKKKIDELKGEIHDLNHRLIAQNMHIEHLTRNQLHPHKDSAVCDVTILKRETEERDELNKALAEQTKLLEEQKETQSQLKEHLASAKTFLEEGEPGSFLQAKPAQQQGDGENELIQRQAVQIIRLEDQLHSAYFHVQQLYAWSAYLEGGWTYTAAQLGSIVAPAATAEENHKYDIYAGGELFKLTWAEIQALTKEYLREHVLPTRERGEDNVANDNSEQRSQQDEGAGP